MLLAQRLRFISAARLCGDLSARIAFNAGCRRRCWGAERGNRQPCFSADWASGRHVVVRNSTEIDMGDNDKGGLGNNPSPQPQPGRGKSDDKPGDDQANDPAKTPPDMGNDDKAR
jgi:hypothetical protein